MFQESPLRTLNNPINPVHVSSGAPFAGGSWSGFVHVTNASHEILRR